MTASRPDALVLFGVTGDLAHKRIFPALYAMAKRGGLKGEHLKLWGGVSWRDEMDIEAGC